MASNTMEGNKKEADDAKGLAEMGGMPFVKGTKFDAEWVRNNRKKIRRRIAGILIFGSLALAAKKLMDWRSKAKAEKTKPPAIIKV